MVSKRPFSRGFAFRYVLPPPPFALAPWTMKNGHLDHELRTILHTCVDTPIDFLCVGLHSLRLHEVLSVSEKYRGPGRAGMAPTSGSGWV